MTLNRSLARVFSHIGSSNMLLWRIFKHNPYRETIVIAGTFDEALALAREIDPDYNAGQVIEKE